MIYQYDIPVILGMSSDDHRHSVNALCSRDGRKLEILTIQSRGGQRGVGNEGEGLPGLEDKRN